MSPLYWRPLQRSDIARLPEIDRSETVEQRYEVRHGQLVLLDHHEEIPRWTQPYYDARLPRLYASLDHNGAGWSVFQRIPTPEGSAASEATTHPAPETTSRPASEASGHPARDSADTGPLVAIAVLDGRWLGPRRDTLDLTFIHVTRPLRGSGIGRPLFDRTVALARQRGARRLYVSASSSRHTVDFYRRRGMRLASPPDPTLLTLEPTDIHLELLL
jgi:GNAT superfamily N-acetyltransferase